MQAAHTFVSTAVLLLFLTGPRPLLGQVTSVDPFFEVRRENNILYGTSNSQELRLDIYEPSGPGPHPAIVWLHGSGGIKENLFQYAGEYASRGFLSATINYDQTSLANYVESAAMAVGWLRRNASAYDIDSGRVVIGGVSLGALTALNFGYRELNPGLEVSAIISYAGGVGDSIPESEIDAGDPPALLIHGTDDAVVGIHSGSEAVFAIATEVGHAAEFYPIQGVGHVLGGLLQSEFDGRKTLELAAEFLNKNLNVAELEAAQGDRSEVVSPGGTWKYFIGTAEPSPFPQLDWAKSDFDDDGWQLGREGFGFGRRVADRGVATELDFQDEAAALYVRHDFTVDDPGSISGLLLDLDFDDAFIAYVNGHEVARSVNLEGRAPVVPFDGPRRNARNENYTVQHFVDLEAFPSLLAQDNVLAIQGLNSRLGQGDFVLSNIRLSTIAVPEPASTILTWVLGGCLFEACRRRIASTCEPNR